MDQTRKKYLTIITSVAICTIILGLYNIRFPTFRFPISNVHRLSNDSTNCLNSIAWLLNDTRLHKYKLFINEPKILAEILPRKTRKQLKQNGLFPKKISQCTKPLSFGILSEVIERHSLNCSTFQYFNVSCTEIRSFHMLGRFILRKNKDTVHIVIYHQITSFEGLDYGPFLLLAATNEPSKVYDKFAIIPVKLVGSNGTILNTFIPDDIGHYLAQHDSAKYIPCTGHGEIDLINYPIHTPAMIEEEETRVANYNSDLPPNSRIITKYGTVKVLRKMKKMTRDLKMPFWLMCGTLLGWKRNCSIIPYTTDLDFGTYSQFATSETKNYFIDEQKFDTNFKIKAIYGLLEEGFEITFYYNHVRFDIFFLYPEHNGTSMQGHHVHSLSHFKYYYPHFELCSTVLLGEKVLLPCDPVSLLRAEYGPDWRIPQENWDWAASAFNTGPEMQWPENVSHLVYQDFT